jgi:hypothetical protein
MILADLLQLSPEDWEKLSDEELKLALEPFLKVTRPTKPVVAPTKKKVTTKSPGVADMLKQLQALSQQATQAK